MRDRHGISRATQIEWAYMTDDPGSLGNETSPATAYTNSQAAQYDHLRFDSPAGRLIHQRELSLLLRFLRRHEGADILEVGCGTGRLLMAAREMGYAVNGVDGSQHMLDQLRAKVSGNWPDLSVELASAHALPYETESFEFVYCVRLLNQTESVDYALSVVEEMCRITKAGGFVLIEFVNHYRPRWGAAKARSVRLRPKSVQQAAERKHCRLVRFDGAFFWSMQAYALVPAPLLRTLNVMDRASSLLLPRLSSRCYFLGRKVSE